MSRNLLRRFFNQPVSRTLTLTLCATIFMGLSTPAAMAWPWDTKPGDSCKIAGKLKTISHAPYRCDLNFKKKLVWLPNPAITNKTKALALVAQGCNDGILQDTDSWDLFLIGFSPWEGVADAYARTIHWYQHPATDKSWLKTMALYQGEATYIGQAFTIASTLDSRWSRLLSLWNQSLSSIPKSFNRPVVQQFGTAVDAAVAPYEPNIDSLCNLAHEEIKSKVALEQRTIYTWVLRNGSGLFPDPPYGN